MARQRMVTRTIDVTIVEVMRVNVQTASVDIVTEEIVGMIREQEILRVLQNRCDDANIKYVNINKVTMKQELYGMTEAEFIKLAKVLPPRAGMVEQE